MFLHPNPIAVEAASYSLYAPAIEQHPHLHHQQNAHVPPPQPATCPVEAQYAASGPAKFEEVTSLAASVSNALSINPCPPPQQQLAGPTAEEAAPAVDPSAQAAEMGGVWGYDDYSAVASCLWDDSDPLFFDDL